MSNVHPYPTAAQTPAVDEIKFAYWVPNVSGGLVVSKIEQRTHWGYEYNKKLAQIAENSGFEYALSQVRYMASYGADQQQLPTSSKFHWLPPLKTHFQIEWPACPNSWSWVGLYYDSGSTRYVLDKRPSFVN